MGTRSPWEKFRQALPGEAVRAFITNTVPHIHDLIVILSM